MAQALSITLGVGEGDLGAGGTRNFEAYDAYLAGNSLTRQAQAVSMSQAIEQFEKAVALDPQYAQAWRALAEAAESAANFFAARQTDDLYRKSAAAAKRAVEIAPDSVAALEAAARLQIRNHEWRPAEASLRKALDLAPADYETIYEYSGLLLAVGRPGEALAYAERAVKREPLALAPSNAVAFAHELCGDPDLALQQYERGKDLIGNQPFRNILIAVVGMGNGDRALMNEALEQVLAAPDLSPTNRRLTSTMKSLLDSPDAALTELHRLLEDPAFVLPLDRAGIATWASYLGDTDLSLEIFHELFVSATGFGPGIMWQPVHREMRRRPGFRQLLRDIGLVDYWRDTGNWGDFCQPVGHQEFECR